MAQILHLPERKDSDDLMQQETKRRVWWSLYMIDLWASAGLGLPRQVQELSSNNLPMHEGIFHQATPDAIPLDSRPGLWAHMISFVRVFGHIQDLHHHHASGRVSDAEAEAITQRLADDLENALKAVPAEDLLTVENLESYSSVGLGPAFVALHLGYHHYATLLYFQYLDMELEPTPCRTLFAARCKQHAAAFSDLLKISVTSPGCEAVYVIVAHMTVVSSAALLYTLFFGREDELPSTRERLQVNFEKLIELRTYWPFVSSMVCVRSLVIRRRNDPDRHRWIDCSPSRISACIRPTQTPTASIIGWSNFSSSMRFRSPTRTKRTSLTILASVIHSLNVGGLPAMHSQSLDLRIRNLAQV